MFEEEKASLGELTKDEFGCLIQVLNGEIIWDEIFSDFSDSDLDTTSRKPPVWLLNWTSSLGIIGLFSLELDPIDESWGIVWDDSQEECWFFLSQTDEPAMRQERIRKSRKGLILQDVWPTVFDHLKAIDAMVLHGEFRIQSPELLPQKPMVEHLRNVMQQQGLNYLGEEQATLVNWVEANYGKYKSLI